MENRRKIIFTDFHTVIICLFKDCFETRSPDRSLELDGGWRQEIFCKGLSDIEKEENGSLSISFYIISHKVLNQMSAL